MQYLSGLFEDIQMEEIAASAYTREPGVLAGSPHFRQWRIYSADSLQDVQYQQQVNVECR